jgi:hypothetical protein
MILRLALFPCWGTWIRFCSGCCVQSFVVNGSESLPLVAAGPLIDTLTPGRSKQCRPPAFEGRHDALFIVVNYTICVRGEGCIEFWDTLASVNFTLTLPDRGLFIYIKVIFSWVPILRPFGLVLFPHIFFLSFVLWFSFFHNRLLSSILSFYNNMYCEL